MRLKEIHGNMGGDWSLLLSTRKSRVYMQLMMRNINVSSEKQSDSSRIRKGRQSFMMRHILLVVIHEAAKKSTDNRTSSAVFKETSHSAKDLTKSVISMGVCLLK